MRISRPRQSPRALLAPAKARRAALYTGFLFRCGCLRCTSDGVLDAPIVDAAAEALARGSVDDRLDGRSRSSPRLPRRGAATAGGPAPARGEGAREDDRGGGRAPRARRAARPAARARTTRIRAAAAAFVAEAARRLDRIADPVAPGRDCPSRANAVAAALGRPRRYLQNTCTTQPTAAPTSRCPPTRLPGRR